MDPFFFIKCLLFIAVFILLCYLVYLLAKKYMLAKISSQNSYINVVAHRCINDKLTITVIAINDEHIMIAAGPQGINMTKLDEAARQRKQNSFPIHH
jgi:flagellar biogenesis protein FliO